MDGGGSETRRPGATRQDVEERRGIPFSPPFFTTRFPFRSETNMLVKRKRPSCGEVSELAEGTRLEIA